MAPDSREDRPARDRCSCGRPSTHVRLTVAGPEAGTDPAGLIVVAHCDHHPSDLTGSFPVGQPRVAHASPESISRLSAGPARFPDLSTAALLLGLATSHLSLSVLVVDPEARAVFTNSAWSVMSGLGPEQSLEAGWHAALDERSRRWLTEAVAAADSPTREIEIVEASGRPRCRTSMGMRPIVGFDGSTLGQVLWVASGGPDSDAPDDRWTDELGDPETARFVARLKEALDRHGHAATTIAALVVEVTEVGDTSSSASDWDDGIDAVLVEYIQPLLSRLQWLSRLGRRRVGLVCEEVDSYRDVIGLAERLIDLGDRLSRLTGRPELVIRVSVGVAFPHLPGEHAEGLLNHALMAAHLAGAQPTSGFEVFIGTGPGSSDVANPPFVPVQQDLSAPSASLQPGRSSLAFKANYKGMDG